MSMTKAIPPEGSVSDRSSPAQGQRTAILLKLLLDTDDFR